MSHSYHVTERERRRDNCLNRDDDGRLPSGLSKLDELSLKKLAAKETEAWRRDTAKAGGLRHYVFRHTYDGWKNFVQRCRGVVSEVHESTSTTHGQEVAPNFEGSAAPQRAAGPGLNKP